MAITLGSFGKETIQDNVGNILTDSASIDFTYNDAANTITAVALAGGIDHGGLAGLPDDDHSQYALLAGRAGSQSLTGGTAASETLTLQSTANATKGKILFGNSAYDEVNNRLGIGTDSPGVDLDIRRGAKASAGEQVRYNIGTDEANPLELSFRIIGDPTAANRIVEIQSIEQGVSARAFSINPSGGNVGIGTTKPDNGIFVIAGTDNADSTLIAFDEGPGGGAANNFKLRGLFTGGGTSNKLSLQDFNGNINMTWTAGEQVGIGTTSPLSFMHVSTTKGPFDNLADSTKYQYRCQNELDINGESTGISFGIDSGDEQTAAIVAERTGAEGQGKLNFYTKQSTTSGVVPVKALTLTEGGDVQVSSLTASRALASDASKNLVSSATTSTELGFVSGVSSAIQTQLNAKAADGANADITSMTGLTGGIASPTFLTFTGNTGAVGATPGNNDLKIEGLGEAIGGSTMHIDLSTAPSDNDALSFDSVTGTWIPQVAGSGDVVGPGSSVDARFALFSGTTGKILQDSPQGLNMKEVAGGQGPVLRFDVSGSTFVSFERQSTRFMRIDNNNKVDFLQDVNLQEGKSLGFIGGGHIGLGTTLRPFRINIALGGLVVGGSAAKVPDGHVEIIGNDLLGGTKALVVKDSGLTDSLTVFNDGGVDIRKSLEINAPSAQTANLYANTTSTNDVMLLQDSGSTVFSVKDGGKVGIGTDTPQETLDILKSSFHRPIIRNTTEAVGDIAGLTFVAGTGAIAGGNIAGEIRAIATQVTPSVLKTELAFFVNTGDSGQEVMRLSDDKRVGIGETNPTNKLHVVTAGNPAKFESTSGNGRIEIDAPATKNAGVQFFENNVLKWGIFNQGTDDTLKFQNKDFATRMIVQQDGNVGIGILDPQTILSFVMGSGTGQAQASGIANVNTTSIGNVGTGEDDLMTYSLPANSLNTNGKSIRITAWGTISTSNSKTIRLKFGATIIQQIGATTSGGLDWKIEGLVIRTGAATQKAIATQLLDTIAQDSTISSPTETLSSVVVIKVTGEGIANDDIKQEGMLVEYLN